MLRYRKPCVILGLVICMAMVMAGCSSKQTSTSVTVESKGESVTISSEKEDVDYAIKKTKSGFSVSSDVGTLTGTLITGEEADSLNSQYYNSDDYSVITVQNQNGFAFMTDEKKPKYVHVFPVKGCGAYVQMTSDKSVNVIYQIESDLKFEGGKVK